MGNRGEERPRCVSCGKLYRSKCRNCNIHHTRPTSRGGDDDQENLVQLKKESEHDTWHNLTANFRVGEVARLVLNDWDTFNPHREKHEEGTDPERLEYRITSWNTLFGEGASKWKVLEIIISKFAKRKKDREHIRRVLTDAVKAGKLDISTYIYLIQLLDKKGVE